MCVARISREIIFLVLSVQIHIVSVTNLTHFLVFLSFRILSGHICCYTTGSWSFKTCPSNQFILSFANSLLLMAWKDTNRLIALILRSITRSKINIGWNCITCRVFKDSQIGHGRQKQHLFSAAFFQFCVRYKSDSSYPIYLFCIVTI